MMSNEFPELANLSEEERKVALAILSEFSNTGSSKTFNELLVSDYEEVPVDVETFLYDPKYLGKGLIDPDGRKTVYPYWVETLKKIFPDPLKPAQYNTLALTGAIGLGKSFMAVLVGLYELYRMLCLKDPYLYYGLQPIDKITFALMNITLDAAQGVAWDKFQQLAQSSEWFMAHGTVSKGNVPRWSPEKKIELICGSQSRHIIGRAVFWCLDGETIINSNLGDCKIKELVGKQIKVPNVDSNGNVIWSDTCTVLPTATSSVEYKIELEDGTIITCTPEHRFMLTDGSYKEAQHLTEDDDILEFVPYGYVYKITNKLNGKFYIGKRVGSNVDDKYWGSGILIQKAISKYGISSFTREILKWAQSKDELEDLEKFYIESTNALSEGYNIASGGTGGNTVAGTIKITNGTDEMHIAIDAEIPIGWYKGSKMKGSWTPERREAHSLKMSGSGNSQWHNGVAHSGEKNGRFGKPVSQHTRELISNSNKGKTRTVEQKKRLSNALKGCKKAPDFGAKISSTATGKRAFNNGVKNIWVMKNKLPPEGFVEGWIKK